MFSVSDNFILLYNEQVTVAFNKDPSPVKLNLGVGAYRTEVTFERNLISLFQSILY